MQPQHSCSGPPSNPQCRSERIWLIPRSTKKLSQVEHQQNEQRQGGFPVPEATAISARASWGRPGPPGCEKSSSRKLLTQSDSLFFRNLVASLPPSRWQILQKVGSFIKSVALQMQGCSYPQAVNQSMNHQVVGDKLQEGPFSLSLPTFARSGSA